MADEMVLWRETTIVGDYADVEDPVLAYALCGQRHAFRLPHGVASADVPALMAAGKIKVLKGAVIQREELPPLKQGDEMILRAQLRVMIPAKIHDAMTAAYRKGYELSAKQAMEDPEVRKNPATVPEKVRARAQSGGDAAYRSVVEAWRKEE